MPKYTIGLPDGRTMDAEAASEAEALAGAQQWYAQNAKPAAPAGGDPNEIDPYSGQPVISGYLPPEKDAPMLGFAQKAAQGATFGWADELAARLGALGGKLPGGHGKSYKEVLAGLRGEEKAFEEAHPRAATIGELGGALATGAGAGGAGMRLLGQAPTLGRAIGVGALTSAPMGALERTGRIEGEAGPAEYAGEAGLGALTSGVIGGALGGVGNVAGRVVGPWITDAARSLHDRGIRLTPGEILGGYAKRLEDSLSSTPFIGAMVRARQGEGIESFNRAAWNEALAPIRGQGAGAHIPAGTQMGHDAAQEARDIFNRRYGVVVPRMRVTFDPPLDADVRGISGALPQTIRPQFADAFRRHVQTNLDNGNLTGRALQDSLQGLRDEAQRLRRNPGHAYDYDLAQGLEDLRGALETAAGRYTPTRTMNDFHRINEAYRNFVVLRQAGSGVGAEGGVFSPAQLHAGVKTTDRSVGKGAMARGEAAMQGLTDPAKSVMTRRVSDSGTPERSALMALLAAPGVVLAPKVAATAAIPLGGLAGLYSRQGNRLFQRAATFSPHTRAALRRAIERSGVAAAPSGAALAEDAFAD